MNDVAISYVATLLLGMVYGGLIVPLVAQMIHDHHDHMRALRDAEDARQEVLQRRFPEQEG